MYYKKKPDYMPSYKIIFIGTKGVGKSEIIRQFVNLSFSTQYNPTESFASYNKIINLNPKSKQSPTFVRLNIIDAFPINHELVLANPDKLTGEKAVAARRMQKESESFFRNIDLGDVKKQAYAFVFVYESGDQKSFDLVVDFINTVHNSETGPERVSKKNIKTYKMLVENKSDLNNGKKQVDEKNLHHKIYDKYKIVGKKILSAKSHRNRIKDMIFELVRKIHNDPEVKMHNKSEELVPDKDKNAKKKKGPAPSRSCCGGGYTEEEVLSFF